MDSYPQLWFRRTPGEDTVLLLVSLTSSHKIPLNSCGAQLLPQSCLLSGQVSPCWAHAAHSHWPQAHISTQPCHHSFCVTAAWAGSDWCLLVSRKKGEGVTTFEKQEIGFFHAISLFLLLIWFHRLVTSQQAWLCDRNKVSLFAVGPCTLLGPISHWTVSNALSCCKLWGGSISSCFHWELSCIKMLWLFPWQVLKTSYNYFSYRCKEAGSIMFRWSHLSPEVSKAKHNLIAWQNSCSVFAGTPELWVRTFQAWDPDLVTPE